MDRPRLFDVVTLERDVSVFDGGDGAYLKGARGTIVELYPDDAMATVELSDKLKGDVFGIVDVAYADLKVFDSASLSLAGD